LPPSVAAAALASVEHVKETPALREQHRAVVAKVRARLRAVGIPTLENPSHIVPVMVKDPVKCKMITDWLLEKHGIYVQPINYPTVDKGAERLRLTPSPVHTDADIDRLVSALSEIWSHCALSRAVA
jgi:5-aminolevulinate synthase